MSSESINKIMDDIDKSDKRDIYELKMNKVNLDMKNFKTVLEEGTLDLNELSNCEYVFNKIFRPLNDHQSPLYEKYNEKNKSIVRHMHMSGDIDDLNEFFKEKNITEASPTYDMYLKARVLYYMARRGFSLSVDAYYDGLEKDGKPLLIEKAGAVKNPKEAPELIQIVEYPRIEPFKLFKKQVVETDITKLHPEKPDQAEGPDNPGAFRMEAFVHGVKTFKAGVDGMLSKLEKAKKEMLRSQTDKSKNFYGFEREGSGSYQKMTQSLHDLMQKLESGNYSPEQVKESMKKAYKAAKNYYVSHVGFTGYKLTDKGKFRLRASEYLVNRLPVMMNTYDNLRRGVSYISDQFGNAYGNSNYNEIEGACEEMLRVNPEVKKSIEARKAYRVPKYDELNKISIAQMNLREKLGKFSKTMFKKYEYSQGHDYYLHVKNSESVTDKAKYFTAKKYMDKIYRPKISVLEAEALEHAFNNDAFKKEYEALAKNPVFKAFVRNNPEAALSGWAAVETRTDNIIEQLKLSTTPQKVNELKTKVGNALYDAEHTNNMQQRQNKANECVKELAEMITDQILQSSKMRPVVNQMASQENNNIRESIVNSVKRTIIRSRVLDIRGNEGKVQRISRVLNDNNLKATAIKNYQRTAANQINHAPEHVNQINNNNLGLGK